MNVYTMTAPDGTVLTVTVDDEQEERMNADCSFVGQCTETGEWLQINTWNFTDIECIGETYVSN